MMWAPHVTFREPPVEVIAGRFIAGVMHHPVVGEVVVVLLYRDFFRGGVHLESGEFMWIWQEFFLAWTELL